MTAAQWLVVLFAAAAAASTFGVLYAWTWAFRTALMARCAVKDARKAAALARAQYQEMMTAKDWYDAATARELAAPREPW